MEKELEVVDFIREQIPDWDDQVKITARYKAFNGQKSDWEPQFQFWRDLIIKIARRFNLIFLYPSLMKNVWFDKGGLTPLCLDDVLLEMYKAGNLLRMSELGDPTCGRLSQLLKKIIYFPTSFTSTSRDILNDRLILKVILEDKAADIVKALMETHWTSSCIITMKKFESLFKEHNEAYVVLSYLSRLGKARYFSVKRKELIEGVKVSLSCAVVSGITKIDSAILQLVWTLEDLDQQDLVIHQQYTRLRKSTLTALRSGDKIIALRNARQLKLASENREKLKALSNRVEDVLHLITNAETVKKVSEAVQVGARAVKENRVQVDDVLSCLEELDEFKNSQEILYENLESISSYSMENEDVEEELKKMESEIRREQELYEQDTKECEKTPDSLCDAMLHLNLENETRDSTTSTQLEPA